MKGSDNMNAVETCTSRGESMKAWEAAREIVSMSGMSMIATSRKMGKTDNYLASSLGQAKDMNASVKCTTMSAIAHACGYELCLVKKDKVRDHMLIVE